MRHYEKYYYIICISVLYILHIPLPIVDVKKKLYTLLSRRCYSPIECRQTETHSNFQLSLCPCLLLQISKFSSLILNPTNKNTILQPYLSFRNYTAIIPHILQSQTTYKNNYLLDVILQQPSIVVQSLFHLGSCISHLQFIIIIQNTLVAKNFFEPHTDNGQFYRKN